MRDRRVANLSLRVAKSGKKFSSINGVLKGWRSLAESNRSLHRERVAS
jgi:hypothetical protein